MIYHSSPSARLLPAQTLKIIITTTVLDVKKKSGEWRRKKISHNHSIGMTINGRNLLCAVSYFGRESPTNFHSENERAVNGAKNFSSRVFPTRKSPTEKSSWPNTQFTPFMILNVPESFYFAIVRPHWPFATAFIAFPFYWFVGRLRVITTELLLISTLTFNCMIYDDNGRLETINMDLRHELRL